MQIYLLGALLFCVALAVFVFQNTAMVTVHFLNWASPDVSLAVVLLIAVCAGALVALLADSFRYFKLAKRIQELTGMNQKLQKEVQEMRNRSSRENKGDPDSEPRPE
jgi:uncharacterized integral membrane protein